MRHAHPPWVAPVCDKVSAEQDPQLVHGRSDVKGSVLKRPLRLPGLAQVLNAAQVLPVHGNSDWVRANCFCFVCLTFAKRKPEEELNVVNCIAICQYGMP